MSYASLKTLRPFFTNKCGRLLAGGKVYTYEVGTLTPKATYKDAAGLTKNTNPIVLDVSGETDIYINSDYRFQIFDKDGVLIDDVDSVAPTQRISSAFLIDESGFNQAQINATKEDTLNKGVAGGYPSLDENSKIPTEQQYEASTTQNGIVQLVDDLTTGGIDKALTAEQGKVLNDQAFGVDQTAKSVAASRAINTNYTNTTGKPIFVAIQAGSNENIILNVNGVGFSDTGVIYGWAFGMVGAGSVCTAAATVGAVIGGWVEFTI